MLLLDGGQKKGDMGQQCRRIHYYYSTFLQMHKTLPKVCTCHSARRQVHSPAEISSRGSKASKCSSWSQRQNQTEVVEQADKEISLGFKNRQGLSFPHASKKKTQLKKTATLLLQHLLLLPPRKNSLGSPSLTLWKKIRVWGFNQRA